MVEPPMILAVEEGLIWFKRFQRGLGALIHFERIAAGAYIRAVSLLLKSTLLMDFVRDG
jgi:hypothetical protein